MSALNAVHLLDALREIISGQDQVEQADREDVLERLEQLSTFCAAALSQVDAEQVLALLQRRKNALAHESEQMDSQQALWRAQRQNSTQEVKLPSVSTKVPAKWVLVDLESGQQWVAAEGSWHNRQAVFPDTQPLR